VPAFWFPLLGRRRLRSWCRRVVHRYWQLSAECDELRRHVRLLEAEAGDLGDLVANLKADLAQQRTQHNADLVTLAPCSRAVHNVRKICAQGRAAGVTAVSIDKVAAAVDQAGW
jgi:hypothetical protein